MRIFVLTGAGISSESGLGTFRDPDGVWARFDPMKLATPEAFADDPETVHAFYNARREGLLAAEPNAAHLAVARLQREIAARGGQVYLCTQNIDDLHERAGSVQVHHMHGELLKARCGYCGAVTAWREALGCGAVCVTCRRSGGMRPHVVWFGEMPIGMGALEDALELSDLFVAIGTSGAVYPAAGFVQTARVMGIDTCELNLEPSDNAHLFNRSEYGPASDVVPRFVERILAAQTVD